jgi:hypothetical protein
MELDSMEYLVGLEICLSLYFLVEGRRLSLFVYNRRFKKPCNCEKKGYRARPQTSIALDPVSYMKNRPDNLTQTHSPAPH